MIAILNYGLGNIKAFLNIYEKLKIDTIVAENPKELAKADKIILPGVGSFDNAMNLLNKSGMRDELDNQVLRFKKPILGVCVGMQIMGKRSEEGSMDGLNWIDGNVVKFSQVKNFKLILPHMGWNSIRVTKKSSLFENISDDYFYFLHSYYFQCNQKQNILSESTYDDCFSSGILKNNIHGVQFHPEKSHNNGLTLLKNFAIGNN